MVGREKKKKKRVIVNESILMEKWDGFFRSLLGGVDGRVVKGAGKEVRKDGKEDISREEIKMMLGGGG